MARGVGWIGGDTRSLGIMYRLAPAAARTNNMGDTCCLARGLGLLGAGIPDSGVTIPVARPLGGIGPLGVTD